MQQENNGYIYIYDGYVICIGEMHDILINHQVLNEI